ncbi:hypothetical protein L1987_12053 [Smallanthus sonchifolius]|uniref:Uncharacterized protein n=1 Tax=Smallanthus sonchifolius TaxID=185202 RepID=A0ACB9JD91_9ASTR|nr:hypothetical protein L1987_12053 [Smallanthus sonchifolius]
MMRSVIGEVKDMDKVGEIKKMVVEAGYVESPVCYLGGLKFMIVKDKRTAVEFLDRKKEFWDKVLRSAVLWGGQEVVFDRLVCIRMLGVPVQLRDSKVFGKIGELFGEVVGESIFSWLEVDNSWGECFVLSSLMRKIDEEVEVVWEGRRTPIWVVEVESSRIQSMIEDLSSSFDSPATTTASAVREDGLEEGEIGPNQVLEEPKGRLVEGHRSSEGINVVGNVEHCLHGENGRTFTIPEECGVSCMDNGGPNVLAAQEFINSEHIKNLGRFNVGRGLSPGLMEGSRSRKRPRGLRSPEVGLDTSGPNLKGFTTQSSSSVSFPDLNSPLPFLSANNGSGEDSELNMEPNLEAERSKGLSQDDGKNDGELVVGLATGGDASGGILQEVADTVRARKWLE